MSSNEKILTLKIKLQFLFINSNIESAVNIAKDFLFHFWTTDFTL